VAAFRDRSRTDRVLHLLQARGVRKGLYGRSRGWLWVLVAVVGLRQFRKLTGGEPDIVYRGELRAGETIRISHKPETYQGKAVRSRRRTPVPK
jgi:hypothetical protein